MRVVLTAGRVHVSLINHDTSKRTNCLQGQLTKQPKVGLLFQAAVEESSVTTVNLPLPVEKNSTVNVSLPVEKPSTATAAEGPLLHVCG